MTLANRYHDFGLKILVERELAKNISAKNSMKLFVVANKYNRDYLKNKVCEFITKRFDDVKKKSDFKSIRAKNLISIMSTTGNKNYLV